MTILRALLVVLVSLLYFPAPCHGDCISYREASQHVGETRCVKGTIVRVEQGARGVHYLDFCEDFRLCPFVAVIFSWDLKHIGDVRQLQGRLIEVHGDVKQYDGRAEIIVKEARQLQGEMARIPPLPKDYDVEKQGHYSAGKFSHPKAAKAATTKRQPATLPIEVPEDAPE